MAKQPSTLRPTKPPTLDVWIIQSNTVYREVPYAVVADWAQQGRLLEEDKVRAAGTNEWKRLGAVSDLAAFLPRAEPNAPEDKAEALEPVEFDIGWKRRSDEQDDDVDMIPLIDISLVLLIFFMMMPAAVAVAGALINTPQAQYKLLTQDEGLWVGIEENKDHQPVYSFGMGKNGPDKDNSKLTSEDELVQRLKPVLQDTYTDVRIRADRSIPFDVIGRLIIKLDGFKDPQGQHGVHQVLAEVSEKRTS